MTKVHVQDVLQTTNVQWWRSDQGQRRESIDPITGVAGKNSVQAEKVKKKQKNANHKTRSRMRLENVGTFYKPNRTG